ncbi:MAG: PorT family protein [Muribaculaceae bacterium]|nr:PorT family protein [Muribaculaceae bacterium]
MKKTKISVLLLLLALFAGFSAQAKTGFSIGPKVGMNVNKMSFSGSKVLDGHNRCGFTGGVTAEFIVPIIGVGADLSVMYSHMKSYYTITTTDVPGIQTGGTDLGYTVHGNFFEIPLHIKYKLGLPAIESIISPYIYTGPSVAFKISGEDSYMGTKKTQWGWDLGLGIELIRHLQIGAGYTFGINKLVNNLYDDVNAGHDVKVKNNYWTITAAWLF